MSSASQEILASTLPGGPAERVVHHLHGYRLVTDIVEGMPPGSPLSATPDHLGGDPRESASSVPTMEVLRGRSRPVPDVHPDGELLALLSDGERETYYAFARDDDRLILRFHRSVDFESDPGLTRATGHVAPGVEPGLLGVLLSGSVMAARLILDGHLVLHASAVATPAGALAFVGASGVGKSTLAALGMAAGYGIVTDDVLRVDLDGDEVVVWPGAVEARLRESARSLTGLVAGGTRDTADGRCAVSGSGVAVDPTRPLRLAGIVVPRPDRQCAQVSAKRLRVFEALGETMSAPRIVGWCEQRTLGQQFQLVADACERVPMFAVDIPWGPPFKADTLPRMLDVLGVG